MELIRDEAALSSLLAVMQARRERQTSCLLSAAMSSGRSDAQLRAAVDLMLPMAQSRSVRLDRLRDGRARLNVTIMYREGIRMADADARNDLSPLSVREEQALRIAQTAVQEAMQLTAAEERYRWLFDWLACHAAYENARPGTLGYAELIGAAGALLQGRANCQGFADAYGLLCRLAGLRALRQCGMSGRGTHLWNLIHVSGGWYAADVSRGSRLLREVGKEAAQAAFMMDRNGCVALGLRWEPWMDAALMKMEEVQ